MGYLSGGRPEAFALEQQALVVDWVTFGRNNINTAVSMSNLGASFSSFGIDRLGVQLCSVALEIWRTCVHYRHKSEVRLLGALAEAHLRAGQSAKAYVALREMNFVASSLKYDDPVNACTRELFLAESLYLGRFFTAANRFCEAAVKKIEDVLGRESRLYACSVERLACCQGSVKMFDEAFSSMSEALELLGRAYGDESFRVAQALSDYADILENADRLSEAVSVGETALRMMERFELGTDQWTRTQTILNLYFRYRLSGDPSCWLEAKRLVKKVKVGSLNFARCREVGRLLSSHPPQGFRKVRS